MSLSATPKAEPPVVRKQESADTSLQKRIEETRHLLKKVDISFSVLLLGTVILAVFFLAALADHWLFKNGMNVSIRFGVFSSLLIFITFFIYKRIVPFFLYPINPVYAADILERNTPSIKNALLNWILLRREKEIQPPNKLSERILESVAQAAVNRTASISTDQAIDRRNLARTGSIFILLVVLFIAYLLFSPKNPLTSMARVILPFSSIQPPQAVQFQDVFPGNDKLIQGEKTEVSVRIVGRGNKAGDSVYLYFSRDDGQAINQAVPMNYVEAAPNGGYRYSVPFPPGKQGLVSGIDYWFVQGDSRSETYRIDVVPTASLEIVSLLYHYPDYTGLPEEVVENSGDIRAVEGSEVRISVRSSLPLEQVWIAFDNGQKQTMQLSGEEQTKARTTISLPNYSNEENRIRNFSFRAIDHNGNESRQSPVFRMEVLPDRPPIVQWSDIDEKLKNVAQIEIPQNGSMELPIQAEDPDFGLRYLRFHVESGNKLIRPVNLLESPSSGPTEHSGNISKMFEFSPTKSRLSAGDTAEIWVEAFDTRLPEPNVSTTRRISVHVLDLQRKEEKQGQKEEQNQDKQSQENQQSEQKPDSEENDSGKTNDKQDQFQEQESSKNSSKDDSGKDESNRQAERNQSSDDEGNKNRNDSSKNDQENNRQNAGQKDNQNNGNTQDESQGRNGDQQNDQNSGSSQQNQEQNQQGGQTQQSQKSSENQQGQQNDSEQQQSADADKDPGDAFDRIIEHMKKNGKLPPENDSPDSEKEKKQTEDKQQKNEDDGTKPEQKQDKQAEQEKRQKNSDQQQSDSDCENGQCDRDSQGSGNSGSKPKNKEQGSGQGSQNGETQDTDENPSQGGNTSEKSADSDSSGQDSEGESDGKQETQKRKDERDRNEGQTGQEDDKNDEQGAGGNKNRSPGKEGESGSTSGGDQQGDPNSDREKRQGDDRNNDRQDVPVDPNDQTPRKRDDSLDPNTEDRRNQGGDSTDPKETKRDLPTDTISSGEEGKGQETTQQGQSDRTQTSESGKRGDQGSEGVEQEGGSSGQGKDKKQSGQGDESETQDSNRQDGMSNDPKAESGQSAKEQMHGQQGQQHSDKQQTDKNSNQQSEEGQTGEMSSTSSSKPNTSDPSRPENGDQTENNNGSGMPSGGQGNGSFGHQETEKEAVNQEYAQKVGNLVLEYLEDQLKDKPNQELLDKLGWTEEQLREYHRKWKEMSENSRQDNVEPDRQSRDDWKEFLKSLDLKPGVEQQNLQDSKTRYQDGSRATESRRYAPPPKLRERFKNYTKGIGQ